MSICSYSRDPEPCPSKGSPDYADCHLSSPDYLSDSDTDISDSDSEPEEPKFPSTIPHFGSDLECFEEVFPSLINGLQNAGDAFEVGWLAGCVHDVILCLALHLTNNHSVFPKTKANLLVEALEARYDRPLPTGDGETCPPEGVTEWIKPKQLLDLFNLIHETVELDYPAGVPLTDKEVEFKIGEKESMFGTMLDNAIKEMWGEDEDDEDESHEEVYTMRGGWISARDEEWTYPAWVYGPERVHGLVQLEPDSTPVEYTTTGDPVPMDAFSIPYTGPYPVEGKCLICMDELSNFDFGLLVARCTNGHVFHNLCLDKWVNCSAMDNANLCPHDRERLCDPRPRMHLGFLVPPPEPSDIDDEEEDEGSIMDADESDYEGFDADAEGEDEDLFSMDVDEEEEADCVPRCEAAGSIFFQYQLNGVDFLYPF